MTRHIPPILSRPRRILLDLILYIIAFILAVLFLVPDAESAEIWWKKPGGKYWQECVVISTSVGPVEQYIPGGMAKLSKKTRAKVDTALVDKELAVLKRTDVDMVSLRPKVSDPESFDKFMVR